MIPTKPIGQIVPPYKYQQQPIITKQLVKPAVLSNRPLPHQLNVPITPDNLANNLSELYIEDTEEAASLIFEIVEKDYPK